LGTTNNEVDRALSESSTMLLEPPVGVAWLLREFDLSSLLGMIRRSTSRLF
jgi:hypothetical protein